MTLKMRYCLMWGFIQGVFNIFPETLILKKEISLSDTLKSTFIGHTNIPQRNCSIFAILKSKQRKTHLEYPVFYFGIPCVIILMVCTLKAQRSIRCVQTFYFYSLFSTAVLQGSARLYLCSEYSSSMFSTVSIEILQNVIERI